jgi:hypothetical protein
MSNTRRLETQGNAAHGFCVWLASNPGQRTVESRKFNDQLLHVLYIYECELDRTINGEPATQEWYTLVTMTAQLVELLRDDSLELYPELKAYRPSDEPTTVPEMVAHLLSDAGARFEASQNEMSAYLEQPVFPCVLDNLLQLIEGHA